LTATVFAIVSKVHKTELMMFGDLFVILQLFPNLITWGKLINTLIEYYWLRLVVGMNETTRLVISETSVFRKPAPASNIKFVLRSAASTVKLVVYVIIC